MATAKNVRGAFTEGHVPTIACFNKATVPLGVDLDSLIKALQVYLDQHVAPIWRTPAKLIKSKDFVKGAWGMVFLDDADLAEDLAYHYLTPDGWPLAKIFVRTTLKNGDLVSVAASHELVEMLVDPAINMMTMGPDPKTMYAYESADPVEKLNFEVNDIPMSNFVYPSYFEAFRKPRSTRFDHMGIIRKPFEIHSGGYQIIFKDGKWTHFHGSVAKKKHFAKEDRRGHRSETRGLELRRSAAK